MTFLKISKTQKLPQKHPKTENLKNTKVTYGGSKMKNFRKQTIVRIEKY